MQSIMSFTVYCLWSILKKSMLKTMLVTTTSLHGSWLDGSCPTSKTVVLFSMYGLWHRTIHWKQQGKSEGLIAATSLVIFLKLDSYHRLISLCELEIWRMTLKRKGTSSILHQALCIISNPLVNSNWSYNPEKPNSGKNSRFFVTCDLEIWWMTWKNNRAPLLYHIKLCATFQSHWFIQTGATVRKYWIWVRIGDFFVPHDLENWRMTLKQKGTSSKLHQALCIISNPSVKSNLVNVAVSGQQN